jgi:hypothetical protein
MKWALLIFYLTNINGEIIKSELKMIAPSLKTCYELGRKTLLDPPIHPRLHLTGFNCFRLKTMGE